MMRATWITLALLAVAATAAAAPYPNVYGAPPEVLRGSGWFRQCLRVKHDKPPRQHFQAAAGAARCDAMRLYDEARDAQDPQAADWNPVRACALRTDDHGVLMMLYANGQGVRQDLGLATRHACSIQSPVNEMKSRVQRLQGLAGRGPVDVCDDAAGSQCKALRERQRDDQRAGQLATLTRGWSEKEKLGLHMAQEAARHYARHRADYETGGIASLSATEASAAASFIADVFDYEAGRGPRFSEGEFASLEKRMDVLYRQRTLASGGGIEQTQRAWLAYRDAMELFAAIRYPRLPGSGTRALLTARRIQQLEELDKAP